MRLASLKKTVSAHKKLFWLIFGLAFLVALFFSNRYFMPQVVIGGQTVKVMIADSEDERVKGLSGRRSLAANRGMLFIFDETGNYGIWMKDMRFPIDVIWINGNEVVDIKADIAPETYPAVFTPQEPAQYVLEVNTGFSAEHGIEKGSSVEFKNLR